MLKSPYRRQIARIECGDADECTECALADPRRIVAQGVEQSVLGCCLIRRDTWQRLESSLSDAECRMASGYLDKCGEPNNCPVFEPGKPDDSPKNNVFIRI